MRKTISLQSDNPASVIAHEPPSQRADWLRAASGLAVIPAFLLFGFQPLAAQAPAPSPNTAAGQKPVHHHARPSAAHRVVAPAPPPAVAAPEKPPVPDWPANDKPSPASVVWDSRGLRIEAENSSLEQILNDVSTATGAKVDGLGTDERVFGVFGPGQAREVLSQLLQGSDYNVMMVGDQGQGTPRQILLSSRHPGESHPASGANQANAGDEDTDADEQPQESGTPAPVRPAFAPGVPPRSPQQIMQEMQQRQQQIQQRLQNQQPEQPQNQPPANPQN